MDIIYIALPLLLILVVLASSFLDKLSVPVIVVALGLGVLFGSDVLNIWYFDDMHLSNQIANIALVFILFNGGFGTTRESVKSVALPAGGLATWGVLLTALLTFIVLRMVLGWSLELSLLLSVAISSTDAAATFSIMRKHALPKNLSSTLEIESAANDPMAILLTVAVVNLVAVGQADPGTTILGFLWKFSAGPLIGYLFGKAMVWLFNVFTPQDRGYYYVLFLASVLLCYGLSEAIQVSGMLAVFVAGFVMGNKSFVHRQGIANFSSALSTIANVGMFVLLGVLVFPHQWEQLWPQGILLFLALTFVARPLAVWIGTLGMKLPWRNKVFMSWAGLRGAVPIVLATYPAAAGIAQGQDIFNLVFFAVVLSVLIQGSTLGPLARLLGLSEPRRPAPLQSLELVTMAPSDLDLISIELPDPEGSPGPLIKDLVLPDETVITLVTRGNKIIPPRGSTRLQGWDQVTVLAHAKNELARREELEKTFKR